MALKKDEYPMVGFRYEVNLIPEAKAKTLSAGNVASAVSGLASAADKAGFSEISGVSVTLETEDIDNGVGEIKYLPSKRKFSPLVLKRGLTGTQSELVVWVAATILADSISKEEVVTKTVIVKLLSDKGTPLVYWVFKGAYPTKWSVSGLKAMSNELVIEEIELKYEMFFPVFLG